MKSVRLRLLLVSLFSILLITVFTLVNTLVSIKNIEKEDSEKIVENICETEKEKMNSILSSVQQSVSIMTDIALEEFPGLEIKDNETLFNEYNDQMANKFISISKYTQSIHTLFYRYNIDMFGPTAGFWYGLSNGIMTSKPTTNLSLYDKYDIQNSAWYHIPAEQGRASWIEPFYHEDLGIYVISYVAPVYYEKTFIGVIGIEIDFTIFADIINEVETYGDGQVYIVNKYDKIMYHEDYNFKDDEPTLPDGVIEAKSKLYNDMSVVVCVNQEKLSKTSQDARIRTIICYLVFSALSLAILGYFVIKSTAPIKELTRAAEDLKDGNLNVNIRCNSNDELGDLAVGLQTAIDTVKERLDNVNTLAFTDSLTGVFNKTAYVDHSLRINKEIGKKKFAVVVLHLFNLIPMNDRFGREMGNEFLLSATQFIKSIYGKSNIYRLTGGLFAIILEDSEFERKEYLFKKFIEEIKEESIIIEQEEVNLPIAIGMSEYNKYRDNSLEDVYARADRFMQINREKIKEELE